MTETAPFINSAHPKNTALLEQRTPPRHTSPPRKGSLLGGLVRTARPQQWIKNILVIAAPSSRPGS